jgi:hypothetical protein
LSTLQRTLREKLDVDGARLALARSPPSKFVANFRNASLESNQILYHLAPLFYTDDTLSKLSQLGA